MSGSLRSAGCRLVTECVREYREGMRGFADESHLQVWYDRLDASELVERFGGRLGKKGRILFAQPFARARRKTSLRAVKKLTERVDGELRFRRVPPLLVPLAELVDADDARKDIDIVRVALDAYAASLDEDRRYLFETYRFVDMARKVVGVGSVGTRAWVLLFAGRDGQDPLVLQMKEAQPSVLEPYLGASEFENHGERVVRGQRLSQAAIDCSSAGNGAWASTDWSTTSTSASCGTGRRPSTCRRWTSRACTHTRGRAGGRWPAPMPAPAIVSRSRHTSAPARSSTRRSRASRLPTPTRTSSTTSGSPTPSPARCPQTPGSKGLAGAVSAIAIGDSSPRRWAGTEGAHHRARAGLG